MKKVKRAPKKRKTLRVVLLFIVSMFFVGVAAAVALLGINYMENQNFRETFYCVSSWKVNNKIRVLQISDLHNCVYGDGNGQLIGRVEKLDPDIIVYTGDCLDAQTGDPEAVVSLCAALAKIAPSYYIYGNNEVETIYESALTRDYLDQKFGFDDSNRMPQALVTLADSFMDKLEAVGVTVLKNSSATVTVGATQVDVYGVLTSNPSSFWPYAGESFGQYLYTNEDNLKITAIHEPLVFENLTSDSWGDLMLAGHTHGGVTRIPMVGPLYTPEGGILPEHNGCYVYGRYEVQGRPLIVSSGLENMNLFRINNQPELVIVDINKF